MKYFLAIISVFLLSGCQSEESSDICEQKTHRFPSASSIEKAEIIELNNEDTSYSTYYPDGAVLVIETQQELQEVYYNLFHRMFIAVPVPSEIDFDSSFVIVAIGKSHGTWSDVTITAVNFLPIGGIAVRVEECYGEFGITAMTKATHIVHVKKRDSSQ